MAERIYLYDSTLRDGAQTSGVDFTTVDKQDITKRLDNFGIDYIEGGWPGSNPTDDAFFIQAPRLKKAKLTAFGMTRKPLIKASADKGLAKVLDSGVPAVCLVGKAWDFHVKKALETTLKENLAMIADSIAHVVKKGKEALFDAEHFFDGYKANPGYALEAIKAAYASGARWVVLCDTNGGTLPHEIATIIKEIIPHIPGTHLGIHCHNDTENAIANSIAAVQAGVRHVQGTINGVGERCGNTNLVSLIPTLILKMGFKTGVSTAKLKELVLLSRFLDDRLNRAPDPFLPYVGEAAFAHKGGLHASAISKDSRSYEHIPPEAVGNTRAILISKQAGRANIIAQLENLGLDTTSYSKTAINTLIAEVKKREDEGYAYESALASFEVLARQILHDIPPFFKLERFRVIDERRWNAKGERITLSEATTRLDIQGKKVITVAEGNGPVHALDQALRKALSRKYRSLRNIQLIDYKVRILTPGAGTGAITRVIIESEDNEKKRWITVGVSTNIIDASYNALRDSLTYKLMKSGTTT